MSYLLDTSAVSDYFRRIGATYDRFQAHPPHVLAISTLTEHELRFGLALKPGATRLASSVRSFLQVVDVLVFDRRDATTSAEVRARLAKTGASIGDFDALIAGVALARNLVLVTSNEREFSRVPGLPIENWRT
mgnify:CR=1 FL=1